MNYRGRDVLRVALALLFSFSACVKAQSPPSGKGEAPIDLTGYWVAVITQDWKERMVTPAKGDYSSMPMTAEAKKVADAWDPASDEGAGEQCRSYGAPALIRAPTRLHVTWQDDNTLKTESDYGMQTRLFHFGASGAQSAAATWQGDSVARWETPPPARNEDRGKPPKFGSLKIVTTHLRPGYLRKNGVPYSANAVLTEYWDLIKESNGENWIEITSVIDDSLYLRQPWITVLHFKKEPTGAKWDPTPCSAVW